VARAGDAPDAKAGRGTGEAGPTFAFSDLKVAFKRFKEDEVTDHAAALTYYALMSLFPALLFAVALLGAFGSPTLIPDAVKYFQDLGAPSEVVQPIEKFLESTIQSDKSAAITSLAIGLLTALYGASGAFGASGRALNRIWRVEEGRGFVRKKATDMAWTLVVLALVIVTFVMIFLGGGLAKDVAGWIGLGDTAATVWTIVRWPAALVSAMLIYAIVYYAAPNVKVRRFEFVTPGAIFGVVVWLLASAAFFVYVSNFSNYEATYGTFAGAVILLVWLWLTNTVLLFGAEINAAQRLRRTPQLPKSYDGPPLPQKVPAEQK
jgi:membrane protein